MAQASTLTSSEQLSRGKELLGMLQPDRDHHETRFGSIDIIDTPKPEQLPEQGVQMIVKHTFIELVATPSSTTRPRALTDSALTDASTLIATPEHSDLSTEVASDMEEHAQHFRQMEWDGTPWMTPAEDPNLENCGFLDMSDPAAHWMADGYWWPPMVFDPNSMLPEAMAMQSDPWAASNAADYSQAMAQTYEIADPSACTPAADLPKTTVMLRNLPSGYTRSMLLELLEDEGFEGSFDFVYMPMDFGSRCCLGYAFVNFLAASDAARCWQIFDGFTEWGRPCDKVCEVTWGQPHQGLEAHVERYRNSPVMHETVPDQWKPALFVDGVRAPFPPPTKKIKAPQMKCRNKAAKA